MSIRKIAVLGAGNGGCAAAADLTLRGYEVRLFSRSESTLSPSVQRGGLELLEDGEDKVPRRSCAGRVGNRLRQHQRDHASRGHVGERGLDRKDRRRLLLLP